MRIFLTGGTGVIGRRAIPALIARGHRVTAIGRSAAKRAMLERAGATPIELDLFDRDAVRAAVVGHDTIINLATHIPSSSTRMFLPGAWKETDHIRRDGSAILADAAIERGVTRFIQESFAPIYVDAGDRWIDERSAVRPARYNRSVLDAERSAARVTIAGGVGIALRFSAFYGPDAVQVHDLIKLVRKGWAPLPGDPDGFMSSISHDDAATAVVAALEVPAGIYNVTDDEPLRRREFVDALASALGVPSPKLPPHWFARLGGSLGETLARSLRISNGKLREATGWAPRYPSVREGWVATLGEIRRDQALAVGAA